MTARDLLLGAQIAICAVLVTSSIVAVRGLARSLDNNFGFDPRNTLLIDTDLHMTGYSGDRVPAMQKRMIEAVEAIPGVESVGLADGLPLDDAGDSPVFTGNASDLRPANAAADASMYNISPDYFRAAGTDLLSGRTFTWHDDKNSPRVAVMNREFARKLFGSATNAIGRYYKMPDGVRVQVVGIVEDGKYNTSPKIHSRRCFFPVLQSHSNQTWLVVRSKRNQAAIGGSDQEQAAATGCRAALFTSETRYEELDAMLFAPRVATVSLGVLGVMGAMLSVTGIFGMAAYSVSKRLKELGIRMALGAQRKEVLQSALGRALRLLVFGSLVGLLLGIAASRVLSAIVYQATPRDPLVLAGVVVVMALLGLLATWIPARRALSLDPVTLLREE